MERMKATKPLTYRTRRLLADGTSEATSSLAPGDVFEVMKPRDRRLLLATRKAEAVREPANVPAPPPAVAAKIAEAVATPVRKPLTFKDEPYAGESPPRVPVPVGAMTASQAPGAATDERVALRAEYEKTLGKPPFLGWSADVLREKIAAAKTV